MIIAEQPGLSAAMAAEIRAEMGRQRLSRRQVSLALGYSPSYLDRRFNGTVPFRLDELEQLAEHLRVPVPDLFQRVVITRKGPHVGTPD